MATLGELKTAISERLLDENNTAVSAANVVRAVNSALSFYKKKRFWFNTVDSSVTLTASDPAVTLPSNFLVELPKHGFSISYAGTRYPLRKVTPVVYDDHNVEGTGLPYEYTIRSGAVYVYHYPDQAYTMLIRYLEDYDAFATDGSEDANTNDFLTEAEDLIKYEALKRLHQEYRFDSEAAAGYEMAIRRELDSLYAYGNKIEGSGSITIHN